MMDAKSISIDQSKICADGNEYFSLFEKHIPRDMKAGSTVLLYELANMSCIMKIISLNPGAKYIVIGNEFVNDALKIMIDKHVDVEYKDRIELEACDMKFDCIVMNPPYQRNLHLKILAEAIKHLKDDKSVCVNLSPSQYLQDPLAMFKKTSDYNRFKDTVSKHIVEFDLHKKQDMSQIFSIAVNTDLAIYVCNKTGGFAYDEVRKYRGFDPMHIYDKCKAKVGTSNLSEHIVNYANRTSENFVSAIMIGGINYRDIPSTDCLRRGNYGPFCNGKYNGKTIKEIKESCKLSVWGNVDSWPVICFSTSDECLNFFNCTDTVCYHFLSYAFTNDQHVPLQFLPWLGDAVNPRTKLKGYKGEWTNEDLMLFFNITPEEQKTIKETMEKYK